VGLSSVIDPFSFGFLIKTIYMFNRKEYMKQWRIENKDEIRGQHRQYPKEHPEKEKEKAKRYREKHKEKIKK